ncbi:replication initiation factor domain-containing protein [Streptococcus sp. GP0011]|jgi:DNA-binding helix-turn-helix protein|uniref:replication initiation factor domain-containing protein n=1 Tax=Streptococcus sp. GP0011 TaxID=3063751 RepID=UPI0026E2CF89|nr:replication initiation factor domain-containing protein [Streptococcus sp. GP0011]MDO6346580.1 replication initiation factor domain-containing protein [Streptococcus sp. GP0011]
MEFENLIKVQKMYAFSDQEMSNYLEIDRATLYRWKEAGEIPESYDSKVNALIAFKEGVRDSGFSLEGKVDYVKVTFKTQDYIEVIAKVLCLQNKPFLEEEKGGSGYDTKYTFQNINLFISKKREDMGCMIELKGQACRQYEWYFENEQNSSWRDFFIRCFEYERAISQGEGKFMNIPRLDIALDEKYKENGNFELGRLVDLWDSGLVESRLTMKQIEDNGQYGKAKTIYFGSRQSAYHFCFYQKDIEQAKKLGLDIDLIHSSLKFKNRYEVRMCDDVALDFVRKSLNEKIDMARLAVWVINSKIKVFERMDGDKVLNREWYSLLGEVDKIGFSTSPVETGFFDKQYRWLNENVSGVTALIKKWESITGDNKLKKILFDGEISDKNWKKLEQARVAYEKSLQESRY